MIFHIFIFPFLNVLSFHSILVLLADECVIKEIKRLSNNPSENHLPFSKKSVYKFKFKFKFMLLSQTSTSSQVNCMCYVNV
jgi:hypothetical protein